MQLILFSLLISAILVGCASPCTYTINELSVNDRVQELSSGKIGTVKHAHHFTGCRAAVFLDNNSWARSKEPYADGGTSSLYLHCSEFKKIGKHNE